MQMLARIKLRTIRQVSTEITATCFKLQKLLPTLPEYLKQYFLFSSGLKQISYKSFEESEINSTEKVVPFQNAIIFGIRKLWHSALTFHIQPAETHIRMPELSAPEKIFCISAKPQVCNVTVKDQGTTLKVSIELLGQLNILVYLLITQVY